MSRSRSDGRVTRRPREILVGAEIGFTAALLFGTIILCRSLFGLMSVQPGFDKHQTLAFELEIHRTLAPEPGDASKFFSDVTTRLRALPGVEGVSAVGDLPFGKWNPQWRILPEGSTLGLDAPPRVEYRTIDPDYFRLMGIPVLAGRAFDTADQPETPTVVVLSQGLADWFWPGQTAVGRRVVLSPGSGQELATVVGVVADDLDDGLDSAPEPRIYMPYEQVPKRHGAMLVKSSVDPYSLVPAVRRAVAEVHDMVAIGNVTTLEELVGASISGPRAATLVAVGFGSVALLLVSVGIHGVMACNVRSRTREIGVRTALGANPNHAAREIFRRSLLITFGGVAAGIVVALALNKILVAFLFGVSPSDPLSLLLTVITVASVALLSASVPAYQASRVDPMIALRAE